jgi:hypothetical protein
VRRWSRFPDELVAHMVPSIVALNVVITASCALETEQSTEMWLHTTGERPDVRLKPQVFNDMNIFETASELARPRFGRRMLAALLGAYLLFAVWPQNLLALQGTPAPTAASQPPYTQENTEQLRQLVAPIALYPDSLVAQVLAASTFPEQVVEADRWVQAHPDLKGNALGQAVDQQAWDPSVKALAAFPSILGNMDKNLSWTSSLGDAYYNQQQDVMDAVQVMRQRAQAAGNLNTTPQQTVATEDSSIVIQPATPDIVYVPAYDPWLIYGDPIVAWPGWYPYPGIWYGGPYLSFGIGFGIGFFGGFGWGWGHWGFDWHHRYPIYNSARYYSRSPTFYNRSNYYRAGGERGVQSTVARGISGNRAGNAERSGGAYRSGATTEPFGGHNPAARGYAEPRGESGVRSGAFSGYDHGGQTRGFSSRGSSSFGGSHGGGRTR